MSSYVQRKKRGEIFLVKREQICDLCFSLVLKNMHFVDFSGHSSLKNKVPKHFIL